MGKYLQHPFFQKMKGRWVLQVLFYFDNLCGGDYSCTESLKKP